MKNILTLVGGLLLLGLIGYGVMYLIAPKEGPKLDAEAQAYVDATLPPIIGTWDENAYVTALGDVPTQAKDQLIQQFMTYKQLGAMTNYGGSKGRGTVSKSNVRANFVAVATFAGGQAMISVNISKASGAWKILSMQVTSPALTPAFSGAPAEAAPAPVPESAPAPTPDAGTALPPSAR